MVHAVPNLNGGGGALGLQRSGLPCPAIVIADRLESAAAYLLLPADAEYQRVARGNCDSRQRK